MNEKLEELKQRLSNVIDQDELEQWFFKKNPAFDNRIPIDLLGTEEQFKLFDMVELLESGEPRG